MTLTTDSNVFEREVSKIVTLGKIKPKKVWAMCDGKGGMHVCYLERPAKQIEELAKLRDKGYITEEEFARAKDKLLDQLDP